MPRSKRDGEQEGRWSSHHHTSKWIHGDQNTTDVGIDFAISPAFLEVVVDAFIADGCEEGHIGHADLLLFEAFFPICLMNAELKRVPVVDGVLEVPWQLSWHPSWASQLFCPPSWI